MLLGQMVYFKENGELKSGFVSKFIGDEDLLIISEDISYTRKYWEVVKIKRE
jgi:hypothetical protein